MKFLVPSKWLLWKHVKKIIQPFSKGLELVLSQETVQVDGHVTVVCEEELEGSAMVTTMEELFSPTFPAGSTVSKTFKWLLVNLPSLPHFDAVRATCCFTLRQVSLCWELNRAEVTFSLGGEKCQGKCSKLLSKTLFYMFCVFSGLWVLAFTFSLISRSLVFQEIHHRLLSHRKTPLLQNNMKAFFHHLLATWEPIIFKQFFAPYKGKLRRNALFTSLREFSDFALYAISYSTISNLLAVIKHNLSSITVFFLVSCKVMPSWDRTWENTSLSDVPGWSRYWQWRRRVFSYSHCEYTAIDADITVYIFYYLHTIFVKVLC